MSRREKIGTENFDFLNGKNGKEWLKRRNEGSRKEWTERKRMDRRNEQKGEREDERKGNTYIMVSFSAILFSHDSPRKES